MLVYYSIVLLRSPLVLIVWELRGFMRGGCEKNLLEGGEDRNTSSDLF
jgi:hypothetical protein